MHGPPALSPGGLEALDRDGYVLIEGALDRAWVEALLPAFGRGCETGGTQHVEPSATVPHREAWDDLAQHPLLLGAAAHMLARPYGPPRLHGRNPLRGHGQQGLHADWQPLRWGEPFQVLTVIFMLDAFQRDNGATRVVPGSHLLRTALPKPLAQPGARHPQERVVTGASGSALVMNGHLWHSGTRNLSGAPRRAVLAVLHPEPAVQRQAE